MCIRDREITPARLPEDTAERVRLLTSAIYDILGCSGLIRIDYIITEGEKVNLLEINTTPGTVSYTHLDVYKRQVFKQHTGCSPTQYREKPPVNTQ